MPQTSMSPAGMALERPLASLEQLLERARSEPPFSRDPNLIRSQLPLSRVVLSYFSPEVRGVENVPTSGPVLVVGNHSGMFYMPDAWITGLALTDRRGVESPIYTLAYDLLLSAPLLGRYLRRLGLVPADPGTAEAALQGGAAVLVYPGGDHEACRPWTDSGRVDFGGHLGFIRVALRAGVPVVPVVAHGAHSTVVVLWRGESIARALGLAKVRVRVFPILLGPWGLTTALLPPPPQPSAVIVEFLPALDWSERGSAESDDVVGHCYEEITGLMQATLNRLRTELSHPALTGWARLSTRLPAALRAAARR